MPAWQQEMVVIGFFTVLTKFYKFVQQSVSGENQRSKTIENKSPLYAVLKENNNEWPAKEDYSDFRGSSRGLCYKRFE